MRISVSVMVRLRCPTCGNPVSEATHPAMPFCSERCRDIDLGRWLNEDFGLPVIPDPEADEQPEQDEQGTRDEPDGESIR